MTIDQWTSFFAWTSVLHIALLSIATLALIGMRSTIARIHGPLLGLEDDELNRLYTSYLAGYKVLIFVFALVPYLALRFLM